MSTTRLFVPTYNSGYMVDAIKSERCPNGRITNLDCVFGGNRDRDGRERNGGYLAFRKFTFSNCDLRTCRTISFAHRKTPSSVPYPWISTVAIFLSARVDSPGDRRLLRSVGGASFGIVGKRFPASPDGGWKDTLRLRPRASSWIDLTMAPRR